MTMKKKTGSLHTAAAIAMVAAASTFGTLGGTAFAVEHNPDYSAAEALSNALASAAETMLPSVVNISATHIEKVDKNFQHPPFVIPGWEDMFRRRMQELPDEREATSLGSGFFISDDGYILTNNHVIEDADEVIVTTQDEREFSAEIVGTDPSTDVALLKVDPDGEIAPARLGDSSTLRVGELSIAIGNPFSRFAGTVTLGIVSACDRSSLQFASRSPAIQDYIQTDAAINPGNSGGPLVNVRGEVIGINSAINSPSGVNVGIGFAIPINLVKEILGDLKEYGEVRRAFLGVNIQAVDGKMAEALGLEEAGGVLISGLMDEGPAKEAGLREGDVIVEFDGKRVTTMPKLQRMVGGSEIGRKVEIVVIRDGDRKRIKVRLGKMDESTQVAADSKSAGGWMGLEVTGLDSPEADALGVDVDHGVLIVSIAPGSEASHANLRPGYVIQKIGEYEIDNLGDYRKARKALKKDESKRAIAVYVRLPGGGQRYFALSRK
jgi:serine protease Do